MWLGAKPSMNVIGVDLEVIAQFLAALHVPAAQLVPTQTAMGWPVAQPVQEEPTWKMTELVLVPLMIARNVVSTITVILRVPIAQQRAKSAHLGPTRQPSVGHRKMYVVVDLVRLGTSQVKMVMGLVWLVHLASFNQKWGLTRAALVQPIPILHTISQRNPLEAANIVHLRAFRLKALL